MTPNWTTPAGFLGTATELTNNTFLLTAAGALSYTLISGSLPPGLSLSAISGLITGTPDAVLNTTHTKFVVRATNASGVSDRTFTLDVSGSDKPTWTTPAGYLNVGIEGEPYAINKQYVNYQLVATPNQSPSGSKLTYIITSKDGSLPPGLTLSDNGVISGFLSDSLVSDGLQSATGGYDDEAYDNYSYDHFADTTSTSIGIPKIYNFRVTATDGVESTSSIFKILVVSPPMIRTPELIPVEFPSTFVGNITTATTGTAFIVTTTFATFTGTSYIVTVPAHNLSNGNYVSFAEVSGTTILNTNSYYVSVVSPSTLKLYVDHTLTLPVDGSGFAPYLGNGKLYKNILAPNENYVPPVQFINGTDLGTLRANNNQDISVAAYNPYPSLGAVVYTLTTTTDPLTQLPPDLRIDPVKGLVYGFVPYQPAYTKNYNLTVNATRYYFTSTVVLGSSLTSSSTYFTATLNLATSTNIFSLSVKGEVESTIEWVTPRDLGTLETGITSDLVVIAKQLNSEYSVKYRQTSGTLPPGLTLERDGTLSGSISHNSTGTYSFAVEASDVYELSAISRTFTLTATQTNSKEYTKIYARPFWSPEQRESYREFITNEFTFDPKLMYRYFDPNFGVQSNIKMNLEFGIEKVNASEYVTALQENFYRKRLYFGDIKVAIAKDSNGTVIYEVVYIDVVDDQVNSEGVSAPPVIYNGNSIYYPASVDNMRQSLEHIVLPNDTYIGVNYDYLPRFMTTAQTGSYKIPGYIKVIPLCYTLPGNGAKIVSRIKISGYDFKKLDFDIDRIIVESSLDSNSAKYLIFGRQAIGNTIPEDNLLYGPDEIQWIFDDNDPLTRE